MANYKELFTAYMDRNGIAYSEPEENVVKMDYSGKNLKIIPVFAFFDDGGEPIVGIRCWEIATFDDEKYASGIAACNDLNNEYRWVKFYIDDDHDVIVQTDAYVDEESCGRICGDLVDRMARIIDGAYPKLMEALWSKNN